MNIEQTKTYYRNYTIKVTLITMNKEQMKSYLIRDKGFLKELYEGQNSLKNKKVLQNADDSELNTLIKFLHFLSSGEIRMKKENFQKIQESNRLKLLIKTVEKKSKAFKLLKASRKAKLSFLNKLSNVFSYLLDSLFTEV